ncbi:AAA family ATPase [Bradyrhizobium huanghuaihaiense]|uniref:AAA family ATPase n=1 Tax=Bradyrhizobium huanghuaihaiense TaxID=990078 RepID=UPI003CC670FD
MAAFLKGVETRQIALGPESLVIIYEASMLDQPTMYRILRVLPDGCRLLLVGDPRSAAAHPVRPDAAPRWSNGPRSLRSISAGSTARPKRSAFPRSPARSGPAGCPTYLTKWMPQPAG